MVNLPSQIVYNRDGHFDNEASAAGNQHRLTAVQHQLKVLHLIVFNINASRTIIVIIYLSKNENTIKNTIKKQEQTLRLTSTALNNDYYYTSKTG